MPFIRESIVTTLNTDGSAHLAPLGVIEEPPFLVLAPFHPSTTLANLRRHPFACVNYTTDVRLFAGWDGYPDGGQSRDFISVEDVVAVNLHFLDHPEQSGIFNCGTGRAQPFNDVAAGVVNALRAERGEAELPLAQLVEQGLIRYIPFPDDLKGRYQSYTQADVSRLRAAGFQAPMRDVRTGVSEYVRYWRNLTR